MTRQLCTFNIGELYCAVDVREVQEVFRFHPMTRVPLAPSAVRGLINLRGQIVTALDMRERLAIAPRAPGYPPMNVVIQTEDGPVSLLVDEIGDVIETSHELYEPPPETLAGVIAELVTEVYKLDGEILLIVDTQRVIGLEATDAVADELNDG